MQQSPIKARIVQATDPAFSGLMSGTACRVQAFAAAKRDADLLGMFARRCILGLGDEPDLAADCPRLPWWPRRRGTAVKRGRPPR